MSRERTFAKALGEKVRAVVPLAHWARMENWLDAGVPDVNYCLRGTEGWLELKFLPRFPVRESTVVTLTRYTLAQRTWIRTRHQAGGRVHLFLKVDRPRLYLLFTAPVAVALVGKLNRHMLLDSAMRCNRGYQLDVPKLLAFLQHPVGP